MNRLTRNALTLILGSILFVAGWVIYQEILQYGFTDVDTFSLINSGRFQDLYGIIKIFKSELMAGRMVNAVYFRPLTSLVFGMEYLLFALEPGGYHFIDLLLFLTTAVFIYLICLKLFSGNRGGWIGLIAGLLFLIHPLQVDNVPAIARLGDLLAGFLATFSLWCFLQFYLAKERSIFTSLFYVLSILTAFLGLCAKEPAVVAPAAIGLCVLLLGKTRSMFARGWEAFSLLLPYSILTVIFVIWRHRILHGVGGYVSVHGLFDDPDFLKLNFRFQTTVLGHLFGLILPSLSDNFDRYAHFVMDRGWILWILVLTGLGFAIAHLFRNRRRLFSAQVSGTADHDLRIAYIFAGFLLVHAGLLFFTIFTLRYLYLSTVAFSILLSLAIFRVVESRNWKKAIIVALLLVGILPHSPLWNKQRLRRWKTGAEISQKILYDLDDAVTSNAGRDIYLLNIPYTIVYGRSSPIFWELPFNQILLEHAIQDYLDMTAPEGKRSQVRVMNYLFLTGDPSQLKLSNKFVGKKTIQVKVETGAIPSPFPWSTIKGRWTNDRYFETHGGKVNFAPEPKSGWPKEMWLALKDVAFKRKPIFLTYDGRGLKQL